MLALGQCTQIESTTTLANPTCTCSINTDPKSEVILKWHKGVISIIFIYIQNWGENENCWQKNYLGKLIPIKLNIGSFDGGTPVSKMKLKIFFLVFTDQFDSLMPHFVHIAYACFCFYWLSARNLLLRSIKSVSVLFSIVEILFELSYSVQTSLKLSRYFNV